MAAPMTPAQMLAVAKSTGFPVNTYTGWETRTRNSGGTFTPRGVVVHITAGGLGSRTAEAYIRDIILGDPQVSFKAQFVTSPDGTIWLVGTGRANHAGYCSDRAAKAFTAASFPTSGTVDWRGRDCNPGEFTYGIENIAGSSMTGRQRAASVALCSAIARHYGWSGGEMAGHGEIASDRSAADPNLNMGQFRADVMAAVKGGTAAPAPTPAPTPEAPKMGKDNDPNGWYLTVGTKDNDQVQDALGNLYKHKIDLNQPAIAGRSLDEPDVRNLGDGQRIGFNIATGDRLIDVRGLDWPTQQFLQWFDRISLDVKNAQPGGLEFDIRVIQFALAKLGLMGDWSWWADAGKYGPRTTAAVNAFYARNKDILGPGDGKLGPLGMGLLAYQTGVFTCTTPYLPATQSAAPANPATNSRYIRPCDARYPLSARFHQRGKMWSLGRRNGLGLHTGEDIAAPMGANIYATIGGKVITNNYDRSYGYKLEILGDDGLVWRYAHTSKRFVGVGQRVTTGQRIGLVGNSGNVSGAHLHLECFPRGGRFGSQLNPNRWP